MLITKEGRQNMIRVENIEKIVQSDGKEILLKPLNFQIEVGEFAVVNCASEDLNSSFLRTIGLLQPLVNGKLLIDELDLSNLSTNARNAFRIRNIGYVFSSPILIDELSVFDNVSLPLSYLGLEKKMIVDRVNIVLAQFNLSHRKDYRVNSLSIDLQQLVVLARAFVIQPKIILLDRPMIHLSETGAVDFLKMLNEINQQQITILMTSGLENEIVYAQKEILIEMILKSDVVNFN